MQPPRFSYCRGLRSPASWLPVVALFSWSLPAGSYLQGVATSAEMAQAIQPETYSAVLPTGFRKGPYLIYPGDPSTMEILWQAYGTTLCTLEWGRDPHHSEGTVETAEYGDDHQHSFLIRDLAPGTRYYYRVTLGEETYAASFIAAPDDNATSIKFMLHGDTQANAASHDSICAAIIDEYLADPAYQSLILGLGDLSNFGRLESDWDQYLFNPAHSHIRERLANIPFNTCIGNHELYESATTYDLDAPLFKKYFPYPFVADRYWSFDYGPAHIIVADLYPWYYDPGLPSLIPPGFISPEQAEWIENDLALTDRTWKFVIIHEPGWSAGPHPNNPSVQDTLHPLCELRGIDIVFAGHNHYYARADVDGIRYLTTSGGARLYWPASGSPHIVTSSRDHTYCKIEISGSVLNIWAVTLDGEIIDQFTIVKNTAVNADPPPAPALRLDQNRPNPFVLNTAITFDLPEPSPAALRIYDVGGHLARTLVEAWLDADTYRIEWDGLDSRGRRLAPGVYWYQLTTPRHRTAKKLIISP